MSSPDQVEPGTILVVDDSPVAVEMLVDLLERDGHRVMSARSAEAALEIAVARPLDVLVCDLHLPQMDGFDMVQRLHVLRADIPVIYVSADQSLESVLHAIELRVFGYLLKRGDSIRLLPVVVRRALAHVRTLRENRKLAAELQRAKEELERRVVERTRQLEEAVDRLERQERELRSALSLVEQSRAQGLLNERLAALGLLAAGVAHDINNPASYVLMGLRVALRNLEWLRSELGVGRPSRPCLGEPLCDGQPATIPGVWAETEQLLSDSLGGVERILSTVKDINQFSRPEPTTREVVDLNQVVTSATRLLANQIRHRARLSLDLEPECRVLGCYGRLLQVVVNLLSNAVQAITEGDRERHLIAVSTECSPTQVVLRVEDSGCGIPSEHLGRVCEPFFTTKAPGEGTGLGLTLCQSVLREHQGRLEITSQVGRGTTVSVILPRASDAAREETASSLDQSPRPLSGLRILLIDDEEPLLRAARRELGVANQVVTALGGQAALELLERDACFDLVLCDLMMPELDGPRLFSLIEERWPDLAQRVLFVTGGAFTARSRSFAQSVRAPVLVKPLRPEDLACAYLKLRQSDAQQGPEP